MIRAASLSTASGRTASGIVAHGITASANAATRGARLSVTARLSRLGWLRPIVLSPIVARPGYWFATACGLLWGGVLGGFRIRREAGLFVVSTLPRWAFGRGGTTIGAVYLTSDNVSPAILEHEAIHKAQWRRYGLAFIPLYLDAGQRAVSNRFEIEAGLKKGGYA